MRLRIPVSLSLLLLGVQMSSAQLAEEFFHRGAQLYLSNRTDIAKTEVESGLRTYPNDPKLMKLAELLKQQQQQNKDDQKQQDQQKQDQQKQDQQKQEQQKQDQEKKQQEEQKKKDEAQKQKQKEQEKQQAQKDKPDEEKKDGQQASDAKDKPDDPNEKDGPPQKMTALRMTPQQAMQLLDTLKAEEKPMPFRPILKTNRQDRVFKDW